MVSRELKEHVGTGPFDIGNGEQSWYYVDPNSITVVCQLHGTKGYLGTTTTILTKRQLQHALRLMNLD